MPLANGEIFAGYRIVRLLGSGATGDVYLAAHPRLPRTDALKVLAATMTTESDYRARFAREADLASKLWHPNIVGIHDRGDHQGQLWISMDYVEGSDAAQLLKSNPSPGLHPMQVRQIISAVAVALDHAHEREMLHRDVKPANIMIAADAQRILLADFGIVRNRNDISGLTATNFTVGTIAYAAPEQLMGQELDGRADQYALAATAYHLLSGAHLFQHSNSAVVIGHHLNSAPPELARTRPELAALDPVLGIALAKNPGARFRSCSEFARTLASAMPDRPDATPADTRWTIGTAVHPPPEGTSALVRPACRGCGTAPLAAAHFCHRCGAPVVAADSPAEFKQVTVLLADVVGSMKIAAVVGPERLREIMTELFTRASAVIERFGGTVDKFTGDGVMALFGAPVALEDHALRACLAALGVQEEIARMAAAVDVSDGVALRLRIGLNSGEVIAGDGPGAVGYTAIGEQVGLAQRMESAAPPGGVMLSESTARLVVGTVVLGEPQRVQVKGAVDPLPARQLLGVAGRHERVDGADATLVGRGWELGALTAMLDRSIGGHGSVVVLTGPAGIGKTRLVREVTQLATSRGVEVTATFCESHATDIPFRVLAHLLGTVFDARGVDQAVARERVRARIPGADPQDLLLLDDLLGIADPGVDLPRIDPDARRRRLAALINAAQVARTEPVAFVVEDVHWIDEASEAMLAEFLTVIPQTSALVLITYRPEYRGILQRVAGGQSFALTELNESEASTLVAELLGADPSVEAIGDLIAERAAGNPLFAQEIIRDLAERGVLDGERGSYHGRADAAEIRVPATLQATIAARVDRLSPAAKRTLSAAAVIGSRFGSDLLIGLDIQPCTDELIDAELIDQVRFTAHSEFCFRHPMIRTVAYESQLKADRAQLHRRLAQTLESAEADGTGGHNAALIAEHRESAGDLTVAYDWHMRAGRWALKRDIAAARLSWERAIRLADALPVDDPARAQMRIAPRTMWCGFGWRVHVHISGARFDELRELCTAAGDNASLAIATAGLVMDHLYQSRIQEAARVASEAMALIDAVGNPVLTVGLSLTAILAKAERGEWSDTLRWSQRVIDLAGGNPTEGNFMVGSPLALALTSRAVARYALGRPGWRDDLERASAMARGTDPAAYATVVGNTHNPGIPFGVLASDVSAIREIEDALAIAERSGDDLALSSAHVALGIALVHRPTEQERSDGRKHLAEVRAELTSHGYSLGDLPIIEVYLAREAARHGDTDGAIPAMRAAVEQLSREGQLLSWGLPATGVLVETMLDGGGDSAEARAAVQRVATAAGVGRVGLCDIWLLRMQTLLARAAGDPASRRLLERYREMAKRLAFQGHLDWAESM